LFLPLKRTLARQRQQYARNDRRASMQYLSDPPARSKTRSQKESAPKTVPTVLKSGESTLTLKTRQHESRNRGVEHSLEYSSGNNVVSPSTHVSIIAWLVMENVKVHPRKNGIIDPSWEVRLAVRWEPSIASHTFRPTGERAVVVATRWKIQRRVVSIHGASSARSLGEVLDMTLLLRLQLRLITVDLCWWINVT
jgi:hypothetical protein